MPLGGKPSLSFRVTRNSTPLNFAVDAQECTPVPTSEFTSEEGVVRTTICPCFARPISSDSLNASTMIRIRCGVSVNLRVPQSSPITLYMSGLLTDSHTCGGDPPSSCTRVRSLSLAKPEREVKRTSWLHGGDLQPHWTWCEKPVFGRWPGQWYRFHDVREAW